VRYPVSKTGGPRGLGGSTPSPSVDLEAWPSRQGSALLARRAPCVPQVRVLLPPLLRSGVVEQVRRAVVTREGQVRALPPELKPPWSKRAMTPDSQSGSCGFESRRGYWKRLAVGERGHPAGFGRRRPQVRLLPARYTLRGGGAAFLASLMSSRRGFESRPRIGPRKVAGFAGSTFRGSDDAVPW
jgi:hypothetical protein